MLFKKNVLVYDFVINIYWVMILHDNSDQHWECSLIYGLVHNEKKHSFLFFLFSPEKTFIKRVTEYNIL